MSYQIHQTAELDVGAKQVKHGKRRSFVYLLKLYTVVVNLWTVYSTFIRIEE